MLEENAGSRGMFVLPRSDKTRQPVSLLRRRKAGGVPEARPVTAANPSVPLLGPGLNPGSRGCNSG